MWKYKSIWCSFNGATFLRNLADSKIRDDRSPRHIKLGLTSTFSFCHIRHKTDLSWWCCQILNDLSSTLGGRLSNVNWKRCNSHRNEELNLCTSEKALSIRIQSFFNKKKVRRGCYRLVVKGFPSREKREEQNSNSIKNSFSHSDDRIFLFFPSVSFWIFTLSRWRQSAESLRSGKVVKNYSTGNNFKKHSSFKKMSLDFLQMSTSFPLLTESKLEFISLEVRQNPTDYWIIDIILCLVLYIFYYSKTLPNFDQSLLFSFNFGDQKKKTTEWVHKNLWKLRVAN